PPGLGRAARRGGCRAYGEGLVREQVLPVSALHDARGPALGSREPKPADEQRAELKAVIKNNRLKLGLATDGDADRFGVLDEGGECIYPNELVSMLFDYLIESRNWTGGVARSVPTAHPIDRGAVLDARKLPKSHVGATSCA